MQEIYLDNSGTTKIDDVVVAVMMPYLEKEYGNPSAIYSKGMSAKDAIDTARTIIAQSINAQPEEIIFTSGGTESNNFALKSIAFTNRDKGNHIITTKTEHKCILDSCRWLSKQGFEITYLPVDNEGFVSLKAIDKAITDKTILVSIAHANNEIGTIQDLAGIGTVCKKHNVYFHTDACQSYTKTILDVKAQHLDLVTINAHKIHGPKGVGALYIRKGTRIEQWQHGGDQENRKRAGTENVPAIVGFGKAVEIANHADIKQITTLRDYLIEQILTIPHVRLNGPKGNERLCNNVNISFHSIEGEAIGGFLDIEHIFTSTGSACAAKSLDPSHVLLAIGLTHEECNGSLRLTLSKYTTKQDIDKVLEVLPNIVQRLRELSPVGRQK
ncbi:cysteine desulfurase [Candidatus Woesearchaeota archaeon]|nr:cysteine desulfurase [Candidatus Woesearchaeota archaeon]